jgi:CRP-like cAMP-binding protein
MSGLIKDTPQYHIATYLGITPVSLSRIKKELNEI